MDKEHVMIRFSLIPADSCEGTGITITADLLVPLDMTPDDLREALSAAYGKRIGVLKAENPTAEELLCWQRMSGLPLKRFFNTSGQLYRELQLSKRLPDMPEDEQLALLASDGMLVKRPILVTEQTVLVGFREAEWSRLK